MKMHSIGEPQIPLPPVSAYHIVEGYIPEEYFSQPPPDEGVLFQVTGRDGFDSLWAIPANFADHLKAALLTHPDIRKVRTKPYTKKDRLDGE